MGDVFQKKKLFGCYIVVEHLLMCKEIIEIITSIFLSKNMIGMVILSKDIDLMIGVTFCVDNKEDKTIYLASTASVY